MAVLVPFYLSMYNNIIEVIFMTNIDQLDKILQSLSTELQKNKEIEDLKQRYNFIEKTGQNLKINFSEEVELSKLEPKPKIDFVSKKEQNEIDSFFDDFDR